MSIKPIITQEIAQEALVYDASSGDFTWRQRKDQLARWNARYAGQVAGYATQRGNTTYWALSLMNYPILAHRLAFIYMQGKVPDLIDHMDGNGLNNSWANLRPASRIMNGANSTRRKNNASGFKGVCFNPKVGKWRASINFNRKHISLGTYDTPEQAHAAYLEKAKELFGEFARAA